MMSIFHKLLMNLAVMKSVMDYSMARETKASIE